MSRVLFVNHEAVSDRMTGPTIRNWELATVLARSHDVTLAVPGEPGRHAARFTVASYSAGDLQRYVADNDVVVCSGYMLERFPVLGDAAHLVVDLYDPFPLENLHMHKEAGLEEQYRIAAYDRAVLTRLTRQGDVFLCASARQRDFWIGWLTAGGRVNPYAHSRDPSLSRLLLTVPFGIPDQAPHPGPAVFRGVREGIGTDDFVVLWGGGIWNWFDPLTLIEAAGDLASEVPSLRIIFPAPASPSEEVLPMRMAVDARALSDRLGLTDRLVFFGEGWVPYEQRGSMLLEADLGVSLHLENVETRFSFRTRVLDYLWAGLPVVTTEGDSMADLVATEDLGAVVPYGGRDELARALRDLEADPGRRRYCGERAHAAGQRFRWATAAAPLVEYCAHPWRAADRDVIRGEAASQAWDGQLPRGRAARRVAASGWRTLKSQGPLGLLRKGRTYLRRRMAG